MSSVVTQVADTPAVMVSARFWQTHGQELQRLVGSRLAVRVVPALPDAPEVPLDQVVCAYFSVDVHQNPAWDEQLRQAPNLRWLHVFTAGADHPLFDAVRDAGATVTTSSGANAAPVAHSALAGILTLARRLPQFWQNQRERRWEPLLGATAPPELSATTATILGMGPIGRDIARLCQAFGIHTVGVRRSAQPTPYCNEVLAFDQLSEALPRTDWLVIVCPLTPQTDQWIDAAALRQLPRHAHLLNLARGRVVVEADLIAALRDGTIAGAYCDVFEQEPLPADSPLWSLPNLLISPHSAGLSQGFSRNAALAFLENLQRWLDHQPLYNVAPERPAG